MEPKMVDINELRDLATKLNPMVVIGMLANLQRADRYYRDFGASTGVDQGPFDLVGDPGIDIQLRQKNAEWTEWSNLKYACNRSILCMQNIIKNLALLQPDFANLYTDVLSDKSDVLEIGAAEEALLMAGHMHDAYEAYRAHPTNATRSAWKDATVAFENYGKLPHVDNN